MSERIEKRGKNAHGELISEGFYAVSPAGHLVLFPASARLKPGFRLATAGEVPGDDVAPVEVPPESKAPPAESFVVHPDGHVFRLPALAPLKNGFRLATNAEIAAGHAIDPEDEAPPAATGESVDG